MQIKLTHLIDYLTQVSDPRRKQGQRFPLDKLLLLIIMAMMRDCYHYRQIARFCALHQDELTRLLALKSSHMPSHVTIRGLLQGIRAHWYIENKLHYTKEVILKEDKTATKNKTAAVNLSIIRNICFNILKTKNKSIK